MQARSGLLGRMGNLPIFLAMAQDGPRGTQTGSLTAQAQPSMVRVMAASLGVPVGQSASTAGAIRSGVQRGPRKLGATRVSDTRF